MAFAGANTSFSMLLHWRSFKRACLAGAQLAAKLAYQKACVILVQHRPTGASESRAPAAIQMQISIKSQTLIVDCTTMPNDMLTMALRYL